MGGGVDEPILSYVAFVWMIRQLQDPKKCYLGMDPSNLWNFNTFKTKLANIPKFDTFKIPLDMESTTSSMEPGTGKFVAKELNEEILFQTFAGRLRGENVENTDPKNDYSKYSSYSSP